MGSVDARRDSDAAFLDLARGAREMGAVRIRCGEYEMAFNSPPAPSADRRESAKPLNGTERGELEELQRFRERCVDLGIEP